MGIYSRYNPPNITNITFSPNSTDSVDPDVTLNVTLFVNDTTSNATNVKFQYRRDGTSTWTNATMESMSGNPNGYYNCSWTPVAPNGIWNYRIWANDSLANEIQL